MNTEMTSEEGHVTARSAWGKGDITEWWSRKLQESVVPFKQP